MIYYTLPILSFVIAFIRLNKRRCTPLVVILLLLCFVVGALRGEGVGADYYAYLRIFLHGDETMEAGFSELIRIIKWFGGDYFHLIVLVFSLSFFTKYYVFRKMSPNPYLSLMIYLGFWFLSYEMNGIRQGLALGFIGVAVYHAWKGKMFFYWIFIGLAISVHNSALVFLPFAFFVGRPCTQGIQLIFLFIYVVLLFVDVLDPLISKIEGDLYAVKKVMDYSMDDFYNGNILYSFSTVHRVMITGLIVYAVPRMKIDDRLKNIFLWSALFNMAIYLLFGQIEIVATRLSLNYRFVECMTLAGLPSLPSRKENRLIIAYLLFGYVLIQVYSVLSIPDGKLIPFHF